MRKILIGSRALNYWYPSMKVSETTDYDVISSVPIENDESSDVHFEWHDRWLLNNDAFDQFTSEKNTVEIEGVKLYVCNPTGLAIIKRSHLWRDLKFDKHITHYHKHLRPFGDVLLDNERQILQQRTTMTMKAYPQGHPNLMQSKASFFADAVTKVYDHDYLHELFAFHDKPLYTNLLIHSDLAWCDKDKWLYLSHDDRLKCIAEEVQVIATERFLVPNDWKFPSKLAYYQSLKKVCTTLCSGWFRDYAIDYYPEVISLYNKEKFQQVKSVLSSKGVNHGY